ncbi:MAG: PilZ domain-containing protein [Pontibacterium sp.]
MQSELRLHARMPLDLPAEMLLSDEDSADVTLKNLSMGGLMVQGDKRVSQLLSSHKPGFPVEVELHFGLLEQPVRCHCRLIHAHRQNQNLFNFGFKLLSLGSESQQLVQQVLAQYEAGRT